MPVRSIAALAVIFCALVFYIPPAAAGSTQVNDVIGTILELEGTATVTAGDKTTVAAEIDTPVHENDIIKTGQGSRAFVLLIDDTELTLSENTTLRLDEYAFDPEDNTDNRGVYSVLQGTFLYASGLIAKKENPDVTVNTPYGAIGIRGTEFWGGEIDGTYGILVNDGQVSVRNDGGVIALAKGEGTSLRSRREAPGEVMRWGDGKIRRATATVFLKRRELLRERILQKREAHKLLREKHRQSLQERRLKIGRKLKERLEERKQSVPSSEPARPLLRKRL